MPAPSLSPTSSIGRPPSTRAAAAGRRSRQRAVPHVQRQQHPAARARTERHPPTSTCSRPTRTPAPSAAYPLKGSRRAPTPTTTATSPRTPAAARGHRRRRAPQTRQKAAVWRSHRQNAGSLWLPTAMSSATDQTLPATARHHCWRRDSPPRQTADTHWQRQRLPDGRVRGERYPAKQHQPGASTDPKSHTPANASCCLPPELTASATPPPPPAAAHPQSRQRGPHPRQRQHRPVVKASGDRQQDANQRHADTKRWAPTVKAGGKHQLHAKQRHAAAKQRPPRRQCQPRERTSCPANRLGRDTVATR